MQKIFEIKRTEAVNNLIQKYERYQKDYVVSDEADDESDLPF